MRFILFIILLILINLSAKDLELTASLSVEPYINSADGSGFETDIVREVFASEGYTVNFDYQPLHRTKHSFKQGTIDGVMTIQSYYPETKGGFFSDEYITYHNFVITLQSSNVKINAIDDLKDKSIVAFQQAHLAFGKEFTEMTKENEDYAEKADQKSQVAMFFAKRVDAILMDTLIFNYYRQHLTQSSTELQITYHDLFEESNFRMAFREEIVRDAFNRGLKKIKKSGRYKAIIRSYFNN
ncbi:MAG: transporter substrate-binding domain-containing protein [Fibrobacterales bacterium]